MTEISSNNKRIAKNTVFLYFRSILLLVITLYTSRVTLQILGVEDYGIYQIVGGVVSMFSMLSSTLASASQRFITYALGEKDIEKLRKVFSTCISLHVILGLIVVALLEVVGIWFLNNKLNIPPDRLVIAGRVMQFSIATFFVNIIAVPYNALIIAHERMGAFAYISIFEAILKLAAVAFISIIHSDKLFFYGAIHFIIAIILRSIYSIYSSKHFEETKHIVLKIDNSLFRKMFAFAGWNLIGNGSLVLRNQGVDIVLNLFFGVTVNAAKGVSNQVQNAIHQLVGNFTTAIKPQLTKSIAQNDFQRTYSLIINGSRYSFLMMLILAVPVIITAPQLLKIWLGTVPDYSVIFVQWTMCYLLLDTMSRMLIHAILSNGDIKTYQLVVGGTKLLAVPFVYIYLLFDKNPLVGVWINLILEVICLCERLFYVKKLLNFDIMQYAKEVIARCLFLFACAFSLSYLISRLINSCFVLSVFLSVSISAMLICVVGMKKSELKIIITIIQRFLKRNNGKYTTSI